MESTAPIVTRAAKSSRARLLFRKNGEGKREREGTSEEDQTLIKTNATGASANPSEAPSHCPRPPAGPAGTPGKMVNPSFMMQLPPRANAYSASRMEKETRQAACGNEISEYTRTRESVRSHTHIHTYTHVHTPASRHHSYRHSHPFHLVPHARAFSHRETTYAMPYEPLLSP